MYIRHTITHDYNNISLANYEMLELLNGIKLAIVCNYYVIMTNI